MPVVIVHHGKVWDFHRQISVETALQSLEQFLKYSLFTSHLSKCDIFCKSFPTHCSDANNFNFISLKKKVEKSLNHCNGGGNIEDFWYKSIKGSTCPRGCCNGRKRLPASWRTRQSFWT